MTQCCQMTKMMEMQNAATFVAVARDLFSMEIWWDVRLSYVSASWYGEMELLCLCLLPTKLPVLRTYCRSIYFVRVVDEFMRIACAALFSHGAQQAQFLEISSTEFCHLNQPGVAEKKVRFLLLLYRHMYMYIRSRYKYMHKSYDCYRASSCNICHLRVYVRT